MEHQDWEQVILSARPKTAAERKTVAAIRSAMLGGIPVQQVRKDKSAEERDTMRKVDAEEKELPILNPTMRQRLIQARCARNMTQQALANATNLRLQVVQDLETGKPVAQPGVLQKMSKVLGSDLKLRFGKNAKPT